MIVRILYTINNSPQYILARSFNKLPTTHVPFQRPPTSHYPRPVNEPHDTVTGHSWNENGVKYVILGGQCEDGGGDVQFGMKHGMVKTGDESAVSMEKRGTEGKRTKDGTPKIRFLVSAV